MHGLDIVFREKTIFDFVSNKILWNEIFKSKSPIDFTDGEKGSINLSHYFKVDECLVKTPKGDDKERHLVLASKGFFESDDYERNTAFHSLCGFISYYNRPFRDCVLYVLNHPSQLQDPVFQPLDIYFPIPQYPYLNKEENMINISFSPSFYPEVYRYCFGKTPLHFEHRWISFPYGNFRGFVLHY